MRRNERGLALIVSLWVLAVMLVLASSFAIAVRTETALSGTYVERIQASWLAEAGLQRAFIELRDHPERFTALDEDAPEGEPLVLRIDSEEDEALQLEDGRYVVSGFDEAARLNLNTADEDTLRRLLSSESELVDAILDWRDDDEVARDAGAESDYYAALEDPYYSRDEWFQTVAELLLLRDVTPARFFGSDGLSPLANEEQVGQIDPELTPLSDVFTVYSQDQDVDLAGEERIDVTEADRETLLQEFEGVLTPQDVDAIIAYREGGEEGGPQPAEEAVTAPPGEAIPGLAELPLAAELLEPSGPEDEEGAGQAGENDEQKRPATVAELARVLERDKLREVYDRLTVGSDQPQLGLVNINTAGLEVLASLPGMDESLAETMINARLDEPFETVGDLLRLSEVTNEVFEVIALYLTTRSLAYRLEAEGTVGEGRHALTNRIEAIVLVELRPASESETSEEEPPAPDEVSTGEENVPQRLLRLVYRRVE